MCARGVCMLSINVKLLRSPSGKTLNTVINNCRQHLKNNLMNVQSESIRLHHIVPADFIMPI